LPAGRGSAAVAVTALLRRIDSSGKQPAAAGSGQRAAGHSSSDRAGKRGAPQRPLVGRYSQLRPQGISISTHLRRPAAGTPAAGTRAAGTPPAGSAPRPRARRSAVGAPCMQWLRHGDPMHAQEWLTAAAVATSVSAASPAGCFGSGAGVAGGSDGSMASSSGLACKTHVIATLLRRRG
jgi:hypothetical protein